MPFRPAIFLYLAKRKVALFPAEGDKAPMEISKGLPPLHNAKLKG